MKTQSTPPLAAVDQPRLVRRFWSEFMKPAKLTTEELAKCDPREMALFGFLVGSGLSWDAARQSENLDILEANDQGDSSAVAD